MPKYSKPKVFLATFRCKLSVLTTLYADCQEFAAAKICTVFESIFRKRVSIIDKTRVLTFLYVII